MRLIYEKCAYSSCFFALVIILNCLTFNSHNLNLLFYKVSYTVLSVSLHGKLELNYKQCHNIQKYLPYYFYIRAYAQYYIIIVVTMSIAPLDMCKCVDVFACVC